MNRYQHQPWVIRFARWLHWRPWYMILAVWFIVRWLLTGATITADEQEWFANRRAYAWHIWTVHRGLAEIKMRHYWTLDESIEELTERMTTVEQ